MQHTNKGNEPLTDPMVYEKLFRGEPLTTEALRLILDSNSIENVVKQEYDNLMLNIELTEAYKDKRELKLAVLASILRGITEYMEWQQEQKAQIQDAKKQQQMLAEFDLEEAAIESSTEKGWIEKLLESLLPEEHQHYHAHLYSKIEAASKNPEDRRAIKAVLLLAAHSDTIKAFIFPEKNPAHDHEKHCQLIMDRILHVGATLKHVHCHKFMSNETLINEINSKIIEGNKLHNGLKR